jgi:hypothetical protein
MTWLNIISLVISLCAISLTVYGLYATRRHNRLSVIPHITGCSNITNNPDGVIFSYDVSNNGIGPARITKFILFREGKEYPKGKGDYLESLILEHLGNRISYQINYTFNFGTKASLKAGITQQIATIFFPGMTKADYEKINGILNGMDMRIEYESFYGAPDHFDTREYYLCWLALHAESTREMKPNAIQQNQAGQSAARTAQAKSAASEQKQKHDYEE